MLFELESRNNSNSSAGSGEITIELATWHNVRQESEAVIVAYRARTPGIRQERPLEQLFLLPALPEVVTNDSPRAIASLSDSYHLSDELIVFV